MTDSATLPEMRTDIARYTILRPFECSMRSTIDPTSIARAKDGRPAGAIELIAAGGYRIVRETSLAQVADSLPFSDLRPGDILISQDTGMILLVTPEGHEESERPLAVSMGLVGDLPRSKRSHDVVFTTRAITQLTGILVDETHAEPRAVQQALRNGAPFCLSVSALNRVLIQALEAAGSINHLIESGHREAWMTLRFNDVVTTLSLR